MKRKISNRQRNVFSTKYNTYLPKLDKAIPRLNLDSLSLSYPICSQLCNIEFTFNNVFTGISIEYIQIIKLFPKLSLQYLFPNIAIARNNILKQNVKTLLSLICCGPSFEALFSLSPRVLSPPNYLPNAISSLLTRANYIITYNDALCNQNMKYLVW